MADTDHLDSRDVTHDTDPDASGLVATGAREDEARMRAKGERPDIENNPDEDIVERAIEGGVSSVIEKVDGAIGKVRKAINER